MVSRREIEEKKRKDDMEAARVFEQFIETFHTPTNKSVSKVWVKAGVYAPDKTTPEVETSSTLYKPSPRFKSNQEKSSVERAQECARILSIDRKFDHTQRKKKSNLESFKEELELLHKDREERHKQKEDNKTKKPEIDMFSNEQGDPNSTNLYVNNLNNKMTESQLMELFGQYGPLASVKIMWPRSDEERSRNKNCGFVAYMSRKDAERGLKYLNGKILQDCELKVGWGKPVPLPSLPVYIPSALLDLSQPPPFTGLPFNAQPPKYLPKSVQTFEEYLQHCVVKVVIPTDRNLLALIHRVVEFVVREGVPFEAMIMNREKNNPAFRFLFDNVCPEHIYYRWKLYSILHGDSLREWSTKEFRMYDYGSIWKPPLVHNYADGMPEDLIDYEEKALATLKKTLSVTQRDHLEMLIHKLTPERERIAETLVFCVEHAEACEEIAQCIAQSLENHSAPIRKLIARLYLISDILYNDKNIESQSFKDAFEKHLATIMNHISEIYESLVNEEKQIFFIKVTRVFNAWIYWKIYPTGYLEYLYRIFNLSESDTDENDNELTNEEINIIAAELSGINTQNLLVNDWSDYSNDSKDEDRVEVRVSPKPLPGFIPSRWEIVDPDLIESQAMTTSKWSQLYEPDYTEKQSDEARSTGNSKTMTEEKRKKLREIEVKVLKYQDDLESGKEKLKLGTVAKQVEDYRKKLIEQLEEKIINSDRKSSKKRNDRRK